MSWACDLLLNIVAEIFGVALSLILVYLIIDKIIERRKDKEWKVVKDVVFDVLRRDLHLVYTELSTFLEGMTFQSAGGIGTSVSEEDLREQLKKDYYDRLEKRNEKLVLHKEAFNFAEKGNFDDLFRFRRQELNNFETKYSKFLDPAFIKALIIIGDSLHGLELAVLLSKKDKDKQAFKERFSFHASKIIDEIYRLHDEFDFDIY
jgi:hypothetical protein